MLRLLLKEDRKNIKREYVYRFLTLLFLLLIVSSIAWITFLVPSYMLLSVEEDNFNMKVKEIEASELSKEREELEATIENLNLRLSILDTKDYPYTEFLKTIDEQAGEEVSIELIDMSHNKENKLILSVKGEAKNRDSLLAYSKKLEEYGYFNKADFPFSDFAKDSEISFSITIDVTPLN